MKKECPNCKTKWKKLDEYTYQVDCDCFGKEFRKDIRISIG